MHLFFYYLFKLLHSFRELMYGTMQCSELILHNKRQQTDACTLNKQWATKFNEQVITVWINVLVQERFDYIKTKVEKIFFSNSNSSRI